jgi:non-ribosomal peptide synthetase component E (peptide arylation enzyme)
VVKTSTPQKSNKLTWPTDVAQCAVVRFPDKTFVEIVTAVIVLKDPSKVFDQAEFIKHCRDRDRIASYKVPRKILVVKELPMSGAVEKYSTKNAGNLSHGSCYIKALIVQKPNGIVETSDIEILFHLKISPI